MRILTLTKSEKQLLEQIDDMPLEEAEETLESCNGFCSSNTKFMKLEEALGRLEEAGSVSCGPKLTPAPRTLTLTKRLGNHPQSKMPPAQTCKILGRMK